MLYGQPMNNNDLLKEYLSYDENTVIIYWKKAPSRIVKEGSKAGNIGKNGYVRIQFKGRFYRGHRVAWFLYYGVWPSRGLDHINRNRSDNRIENLREVSQRENVLNKSIRKDNTSGYTGVVSFKDKWRATISDNGKRISLGDFENIEDAAKARLEAEKKLGYNSQ